jgi:hypothetical protein
MQRMSMRAMLLANLGAAAALLGETNKAVYPRYTSEPARQPTPPSGPADPQATARNLHNATVERKKAERKLNRTLRRAGQQPMDPERARSTTTKGAQNGSQES